MRYGLDVPTTGAFADARALAQLATEAEQAGWDGFFIWDVLLGGDQMDTPVLDPWVALTAIALSTSRIRIGLLASPLARHRPWLVARRLANLDQLSGGRVTLVAGLGYLPRDYSAFGENADPAARAHALDEALDLLAGLWTQPRFSYAGERYTVSDVTLLPHPVQQPRIPIWVAGGWPQRVPFRRAARWDGLCVKSYHQTRREPLTPDDFAACLAYTIAQRASAASDAAPGGDAPFEAVMSGDTYDLSQTEAAAHARRYAEVGATWWIEEGLGYSLDELRQRIQRGAPRA